MLRGLPRKGESRCLATRPPKTPASYLALATTERLQQTQVLPAAAKAKRFQGSTRLPSPRTLPHSDTEGAKEPRGLSFPAASLGDEDPQVLPHLSSPATQLNRIYFFSV